MSPPPRPARGRGGREGIDRWQPNGLSAHSLDLRRLLLNEICEERDGGGMSGRRVENAFGRASSKMRFAHADSVCG